jgi:hypothetical protein
VAFIYLGLSVLCKENAYFLIRLKIKSKFFYSFIILVSKEQVDFNVIDTDRQIRKRLFLEVVYLLATFFIDIVVYVLHKILVNDEILKCVVYSVKIREI